MVATPTMLGFSPGSRAIRARLDGRGLWSVILLLVAGACGDDRTTGAPPDAADDPAAPTSDASALPVTDDAGPMIPDPAPSNTPPPDPSGTAEPSPGEPPLDGGGPTPTVPSDDAAPGEPGSDSGTAPVDQGRQVIDLRALSDSPGFSRVYGPLEGDGSLGVPIAASRDVSGDGLVDFAFAAFQASPLGRSGAGQVHVWLGDGNIGQDFDLAAPDRGVLLIQGAGPFEGAGSEIWMDDVTGDGIGDLLVCRQNTRGADPDRIGAGALSIIAGGQWLADRVASGEAIDLAAANDELPIFTIVGSEEFGRLGIWVRAGDIDADGTFDVVLGADQESLPDEDKRGALYVIRGGEHLAQSATVDLLALAGSPLDGHLAKVIPPLGESAGYHFGATVNVADLDGNGRGEVIVAAALVRSGASYRAEDSPSGSAVSQGGAPGGRAYVVWDDNFPDATWAPDFAFDVAQAPGAVTTLLAGTSDEDESLANRQLGEEIIGGEDYDGDGLADLFIGDMTGVAGPLRGNGGIGYVVWGARDLRALTELTLMAPGEFPVTRMQGVSAGAITTDTVRHGDFDGDGIVDLAVAAPNASPDGRIQAGIVHVLWGNTQRWPASIDLSLLPPSAAVQVTDLWGVAGGQGSDVGDMLAYSADTADVDGDGLMDLIVNEMGGNGASSAAIDVGDLVVISGALIAEGRPDCAGVLGGDARIDECGRCVTPDEPEVDCVRFTQDVQPLLLGECSQCHGDSGGLSVFGRDLLLQGTSDHGPVVVPGAAAESLLIQKLNGTHDVGDPMPPDYTLSDEQIELLARWIDEGARDN